MDTVNERQEKCIRKTNICRFSLVWIHSHTQKEREKWRRSRTNYILIGAAVEGRHSSLFKERDISKLRSDSWILIEQQTLDTAPTALTCYLLLEVLSSHFMEEPDLQLAETCNKTTALSETIWWVIIAESRTLIEKWADSFSECIPCSCAQKWEQESIESTFDGFYIEYNGLIWVKSHYEPTQQTISKQVAKVRPQVHLHTNTVVLNKILFENSLAKK